MYTIYPEPLKTSFSPETLPPLGELVPEFDPSLLEDCQKVFTGKRSESFMLSRR